MNKKLAQLDRRKKALVAHSTSILEAAEKGGRELSADENTLLSANEAELKKIAADIAAEEQAAAFDMASIVGQFDDDPPGIPDSMRGNKGTHIAKAGDLFFRNESTGAMTRALRANEPFCRQPLSDGEPHLVGRCLHSWLVGRAEDSPRLQAMQSGGNDVGGGFLCSPTMSQMTVDLARSACVCTRAGAQTLVMDSNEVNLCRVDSDPVSHWRSEGVTVPASKATLGRITLRSKMLAAICPISIELLEDAANAPALLEDCLSKAIALKIDQACLAGSGAESEPLGIRHASGVNLTASVGKPTSYAEISGSVQKILIANFSGAIGDLSWIQHPRTAGTYDQLVETTTGQPLRPTPWAEQLQRFYTTSLAINEGSKADESYSVIGDFSSVLIGIRNSGVVFRRLPSGVATDADGNSFNAVSQLLEHLVVYTRIDVALLRPSWFTVLSGITA